MDVHGIDNSVLDMNAATLAKMIRDGALEDYSTYDEFLKGTDKTIVIKEEFKTRPFFCSSKPLGKGLERDTPMSDAALRNYLQKTALIGGLGGRCSKCTVHYFIDAVSFRG